MNMQQNTHARALLALNNMGVSLLLRGRYACALETIKDGLLILKAMNSFRVYDSLSKVQKATSRLFQLEPPSLSSRAKSRLQVLNQCSLNGRTGEMEEAFSSMKLCPILMDDCDGSIEENALAELHAGVLLNNYAIAYLCCSEGQANSKEMLVFREKAREMFSMANAILSQATCASEVGDLYLLMLYNLKLAVLTNSMAVFEAATTADFVATRSMVEELCDLYHFIEVAPRHAGAA